MNNGAYLAKSLAQHIGGGNNIDNVIQKWQNRTKTLKEVIKVTNKFNQECNLAFDQQSYIKNLLDLSNFNLQGFDNRIAPFDTEDNRYRYEDIDDKINTTNQFLDVAIKAQQLEYVNEWLERGDNLTTEQENTLKSELKNKISQLYSNPNQFRTELFEQDNIISVNHNAIEQRVSDHKTTYNDALNKIQQTLPDFNEADFDNNPVNFIDNTPQSIRLKVFTNVPEKIVSATGTGDPLRSGDTFEYKALGFEANKIPLIFQY